MKKQSMSITAKQFKAHCLQLIDEIHRSRVSLVITKDRKPMAKLIPYSEELTRPLYGCLKDIVIINTDIVASTEEQWDADN